MDVLWLTTDGVQQRPADQLDALLADARAGRGIVWVDVALWDDGAAACSRCARWRR
jgi:hypothetical protein